MTLHVRTYQSLETVDDGERFYARAIAMTKGKNGRLSEGHSIGFYGATAEAATAAAHQWIADERAKEDARKAQYAALGEKRRKAS